MKRPRFWPKQGCPEEPEQESAQLEKGTLPLRIVLFYAVASIVWIVVTDRLVAALASDAASLTGLQTVKGLLFVAGTTLVLLVILKHYIQAWRGWVEALRRGLMLERAVRTIDAAMIEERRLEEIFAAICQGAVQMGYRMCWVGLPEEDYTIRPVASYGLEEGYLAAVGTRWDDTPTGRGPSGRAVRTGSTVVFQDIEAEPDFAPWREIARQRGYRSVAAVPLKEYNHVLGVLVVYAEQPYAFDQRALMGLEILAQQGALAVLDARRREAYQEIHRQNELILKGVAEGICGVDPKGRVTFVNPAAERMLGYKAEEMLGRPLHDLIHHTRPDGTRCLGSNCRLYAALTGGEAQAAAEEVFWRQDGMSFPAEYTSTPLREGSKTLGAVVAFRDITERKNFESQLTYLANHDPLTGLFNRRRFLEELAIQLAEAQRYGYRGALLFLDVDGFKYVNDTLGHPAGDTVLVSLAALLREHLRQSDILARLGGDEFAVVLPHTEPEVAQELAAQLLEEIRKRVLSLEGHTLRLTASAGIVFFPEHGTNVEELLARADLAMYQAKENGRNCFCLFSATSRDNLSARLDWESRIREAVEKDRFVFHFQPIFDLRQNRIDRYEALLRMVDEDGSLLPPGAFLPVAERTGLIREIDRWVLRRALQLLAEWHHAGRKIVLEVNLSGPALEDTAVLDLIRRELAARAVPAGSLVLEITETAAINRMAEAGRFVRTLKEMGCRFALDDFGMGFCSLNYLKYLPVDYLKIDGSFIRDLTHNQTDQFLVRAIVEIARGLGKKTIAEWVEDEATAELLRAYGVDFAQGYYVGRPVADPWSAAPSDR